MCPQCHGEGGALTTGDERSRIAVRQQSVPVTTGQQLVQQGKAVPRHAPTGLRVLPVQRPGLGQRHRRRPLRIRPLPDGLLIRPTGPAHPVPEVHRGGPRPLQQLRGHGHVVPPRGRESHPVGPGDTQQGGAAHRQRPDRPDQSGHIGAHQLGFLRGQSRLVEEHQCGTFRRLGPAKYGKRGRLDTHRRLCVLISHPPSLPGEPPTNEGTKEMERPAHSGATRGTMAANLPPR